MKTPRQKISNKKAETKVGEYNAMKNKFDRVLVDNGYLEQFKDYLYDSFGLTKSEYQTFRGILFTSFRFKNVSREDLEYIRRVAYELM
jgi:hypothetical protein